MLNFIPFAEDIHWTRLTNTIHFNASGLAKTILRTCALNIWMMSVRRTVEIKAMHAICIKRTFYASRIIHIVVESIHTCAVTQTKGAFVGNHTVVATIECCIVETKVSRLT